MIGDGALTGGMAFEALNNAGVLDANLLVVLNDNEMSISKNVGALDNYLARILSGSFYSAARRAGEKVLRVVPPVLELAKRAEEHVKGMVTPGTLFEEFGFNYIGPIDGHDLEALISTLTNVRRLQGPQFLHVVTRKGKGYSHAEMDPILYHGVGKFDSSCGIAGSPPGKPTYTEVFGKWLCDMAEKDEKLVAITPAMREGSGMVEFSERFPSRYFDVGIAEQHAVTFAAGLACEGLKPVVAIYSTFLQRAYDQLIHDVAIQNLPVVFAIDRGGLVGADGPTHAGSFDLSFLRCIPNMTVMAASSEDELRQMLYSAVSMNSPVAVRYPRGRGPGTVVREEMQAIEIGRAVVRRQGEKVAILAFGSMVSPSIEAGEKLNATVVNMRFVKPLDERIVLELAKTHELLVTVEENSLMGGAGSAVSECLNAHGLKVRQMNLGLPDRYIDHGESASLLSDCLLDAEGILESIREAMNPSGLLGIVTGL